MENFFTTNQEALIATIIALVVFLILRFISLKTIRKVAGTAHFDEMRTKLVAKYFVFGLSGILMVILVLIWGIKFKDIGILLSSVFAVIGVAVFAQWSILSNVTSGIILFFSFPYKIGDRIRISDKEMEYQGDLLIEDIRAYHLYLRTDQGQLLTYPNSLILQKSVLLVTEDKDHTEGIATD